MSEMCHPTPIDLMEVKDIDRMQPEVVTSQQVNDQDHQTPTDDLHRITIGTKDRTGTGTTEQT